MPLQYVWFSTINPMTLTWKEWLKNAPWSPTVIYVPRPELNLSDVIKRNITLEWDLNPTNSWSGIRSIRKTPGFTFRVLLFRDPSFTEEWCFVSLRLKAHWYSAPPPGYGVGHSAMPGIGTGLDSTPLNSQYLTSKGEFWDDGEISLKTFRFHFSLGCFGVTPIVDVSNSLSNITSFPNLPSPCVPLSHFSRHNILYH